MNGPQHYREAEKRITAARNEENPQWALVQAQLATAEAMLALTAAHALCQPVCTDTEDGSGHATKADYDAWVEAVQPGSKGGDR